MEVWRVFAMLTTELESVGEETALRRLEMAVAMTSWVDAGPVSVRAIRGPCLLMEE
jgi:hypothetical protein